MNPSIVAEVERLRQLKTAVLRTRYREVLGEESRSSNRQSLLRRIAWRLQARAEGDLSERARRRALEIADDADLRLRAPKDFLAQSAPSPVGASPDRIGSRRDARLPVPGTVLTRQYGNRRIVVTVLDDAFEYQSRRYRSLSAIAREITGTRWNGWLFFGLAERGKRGHGG
jgi:hypothetical protein